MSFSNATFEQVLDDLSVRFLLNIPSEEKNSIERLCFQIEQAHWYYEDFIRAENDQLPSLGLRVFSAKLFSHCPLLWKWSKVHEEAFDDFLRYKTRIPVRGAIMLNKEMDKCLLVKGWKASSGWGFPKGKINKDEADVDCAIREVYEETGFDSTNWINEKDFIELTIREQNIRLYIIPDLPMETVFESQTRKEISKIEWHLLADLPTFKQSKSETKNKFYMVIPFLAPLKKWIRKRLVSLESKVQATKASTQLLSLLKEPSSTATVAESANEKLLNMLRTPVQTQSQLAAPARALPTATSEEKLLALIRGPAAPTASTIQAPPPPDDYKACILNMLNSGLSAHQSAAPMSMPPLPVPNMHPSTTQFQSPVMNFAPTAPFFGMSPYQNFAQLHPAQGMYPVMSGPSTPQASRQMESTIPLDPHIQQIMSNSTDPSGTLPFTDPAIIKTNLQPANFELPPMRSFAAPPQAMPLPSQSDSSVPTPGELPSPSTMYHQVFHPPSMTAVTTFEKLEKNAASKGNSDNNTQERIVGHKKQKPFTDDSREAEQKSKGQASKQDSNPSVQLLNILTKAAELSLNEKRQVKSKSVAEASRTQSTKLQPTVSSPYKTSNQFSKGATKKKSPRVSTPKRRNGLSGGKQTFSPKPVSPFGNKELTPTNVKILKREPVSKTRTTANDSLFMDYLKSVVTNTNPTGAP
ncbi:mRNA decapping complex catalytic subunit Dcp2 [Schizosaccharomyces japonicus yFS275]|uniref:mRNA decapping complex catalytic subunit Dcp2 n=1 Tax=Schizosaccharomyces japonicus (strain yFS275 / FY16936) TaxID=402676 RepID=B6K8D2_SCHJY|nr:mRNA decapping complex catalytic subunit Dcp2 [Schizosaccharomyces japonicus yFS275]EEB09786.1 mRNA decapping complex catalytic subunit Dcp2 [Schizosaccharomyces japonicus yFS275]